VLAVLAVYLVVEHVALARALLVAGLLIQGFFSFLLSTCAQPELLVATCPSGVDMTGKMCQAWFGTGPVSPLGLAAARLEITVDSARAPNLGNASEIQELPYPLLSSSIAPTPLGIVVRVVDANSVTIRGGTADALALVRVSADPSVAFVGISSRQAARGLADFTTLTIKATPGTYTITFGMGDSDRSSLHHGR
jgi:hypothetical protein